MKTLALILLVFTACVTLVTPRGIALDLNDSLSRLSDYPLAVRCQAIKDAEQRCLNAGLGSKCWADGWTDADQDSWTIAACRENEGTP